MGCSMKIFRRSGAFTMIELLIVMGIIALLAAIMLPTIGKAKLAAMKRKTETDIKMLHSAIRSFKNEYDRYPLHGTQYGGGSDIEYDNALLIKTLRGNDDNDNPRKMSYIKINQASLNPNTGEFVDPWRLKGTLYGTPYYASVDTDYDGRIDLHGNLTVNGNAIGVVSNHPVAVWSEGDLKNKKIGPFTSWGAEYIK